ncbi:hypothetical protein ACFXDJ_06055 [Streptomyces sp. NPDC059443]|uniref:hypothetical protein n=1 Tax=unclassified Streptomyces TaxID=2593676 RepID=UPI0036994FA2
MLPDLAVILTADPDVIAARLATRGVRHRFHHDPDAPSREPRAASWSCTRKQPGPWEPWAYESSCSTPPRSPQRT